jgi:hypothetical protein
MERKFINQFICVMITMLIQACSSNQSSVRTTNPDESSQVVVQSSDSKDRLYFDGVIEYEDESRIKPEIISECDIRGKIIESFGKKSGKNRLPFVR